MGTESAPEGRTAEEPPERLSPADAILLDSPALSPASQTESDFLSPSPTGRLCRFPQGAATQAFRRRFYPKVQSADWNNWHWQLANSLRTREALSRLFRLTEDEIAALTHGGSGLPVAVTPYFASRIDPSDAGHPLRRAMIPTTAELSLSPGESDDPLSEEGQTAAPGLVHRYPDRALFLTTEYCAAYCRYCTRSRLVGQQERRRFCREQWEAALAYLARTPSVRDVILSGGDPLTLEDEPLEWLLQRLRAIPHIEVIRIGTKTPAVLPMRITPALAKTLRKYHPL